MRLRRQGVVLDAEGGGILHVGAGEDAREVEPAELQLIQVRKIVKVVVQHRAVMLGGGDQDRRPTAKEEVKPVVRVE